MHTLIVGQTLSGKTTLAKKLAKKTFDNRRGVIVFDPIGDKEWFSCADSVTNDPAKFLQLAHTNVNCTLIVDEANVFCGRYDKDSYWLATRSRHKGHKVVFITQRATDIARTIRDQCDEIYAFSVSAYDAKELSNDFVSKEFLELPDFPVGQCIYKKRFQDPVIVNIFA